MPSNDVLTPILVVSNLSTTYQNTRPLKNAAQYNGLSRFWIRSLRTAESFTCVIVRQMDSIRNGQSIHARAVMIRLVVDATRVYSDETGLSLSLRIIRPTKAEVAGGQTVSS